MIFNSFSLKFQMQKHREGDWQGFQHFHDPSQITCTQLPQLNRAKQFNIEHPSCQNSCKKESPIKRPFLSQKVNLKNLKLQRTAMQSENSVNEDVQKRPKILQKFEEEKKIEQKQQEVKRNETKRLQRIPIIRRDEEYRFAGKVVYKGFVPKTSDNFMRLLKEVDWETTNQKKRDIKNLHGIEFNSQFQGGNLNLAMEYDLYMRVDTNTQGHRQWFYFSMRNEKKCTVKLHIYRFKKQFSLFQRGMKPYVKSRKAGQEWKQGGENVYYHYQRSKNEYGVMKPTKNFVLSFTYRFEHANDQVFIAAGIPYTYTFLNKQISLYKQVIDKRQNLTFDITILCKSVCGLQLPLLTVYHCMSKLIHANSTKKIIVINARSHPGEASCSWVLDGLLKQLGASSQIEQWMLKENIWLKIVPMLNPDGAFVGNYRTGIIGQDFNRNFIVGRQEFYPEIAGLKKLVSKSKKQGDLLLFLDLHGHSILKNSFIYGPTQTQCAGFKMKKLPYYLFHKSKYFRLGSCKFKNQQNKNQTARLYFQNQQKILSLTCQNSLGLYYHQQQTSPMLAADWQAFGQSIIHSMRDIFVNKDINANYKQSFPQISTISLKRQQKKAKYDSQKKVTSTPKNKIERVIVKIPMTPISSEHKEGKQLQSLKSISPFSSTQINREDDFIDIHYSQKQSQTNKVDFRVRRKSQLLKNPGNNIKNKIGKKQPGMTAMIRANSQEEQSQTISFGRSLTANQTQNLKNEIMKANSLDGQKEENYLCYELQEIAQNFSDEYLSMNDSDSSSDDLPEIQKNYILQYIKQNQRQTSQQMAPNQRQTRPNIKESKDPKISKFRQIRFKSIEQMYVQHSQPRDMLKNAAKKIKLEPHKFKDSTSKSLVNKYNEMYANTQFDDPSMVSISQQKRLNERTGNYRRAHKDPFILIQRKDRKISLEESEYQQ